MIYIILEGLNLISPSRPNFEGEGIEASRTYLLHLSHQKKKKRREKPQFVNL